MTKRILHVAEAAGGVERAIVSLLKKLKKYPDYEHILICSETYDKKKFEGLVEEIIVLKSLQNAISFKQDFNSVKAIRKIIKRYKPDIVYCHSSKAGAVGRVADLGLKNKMIYNAHGWAFNMKGIGGKKTIFYKLIEKFLAKITDKIICISEYEKISALQQKICAPEKLAVINNGIDFDEYKEIYPKAKTELNIPENAYVVGMIGRLAKQKAPDLFVKMAKSIKEQIPDAYFIIIGDGPEWNTITELISAYGLEKSFYITGWVNNPLDYASCFDVATLLSRWEGFGLVLPEYMLLGKPIVATRVDAIPYVIEDAGIIVEAEDYTEAARAVIRLYNDNGLKTSLIENGKKRVLQFNVERTANEHYSLFNSIIKTNETSASERNKTENLAGNSMERK